MRESRREVERVLLKAGVGKGFRRSICLIRQAVARSGSRKILRDSVGSQTEKGPGS